jgi:putative transposase
VADRLPLLQSLAPREGTWERIHATLHERLRRLLGREPTPSAAIIDSQTAKTRQRRAASAATMVARRSALESGICSLTKEGLVIGVALHEANIADRDGAKVLVEKVSAISCRGWRRFGRIRGYKTARR